MAGTFARGCRNNAIICTRSVSFLLQLTAGDHGDWRYSAQKYHPPISTLYGESSHSLYMLAMGIAIVTVTLVTNWATCRLKTGSIMCATQFITIGVTALSAMPSIYGLGNSQATPACCLSCSTTGNTSLVLFLFHRAELANSAHRYIEYHYWTLLPCSTTTIIKATIEQQVSFMFFTLTSPFLAFNDALSMYCQTVGQHLLSNVDKYSQNRPDVHVHLLWILVQFPRYELMSDPRV